MIENILANLVGGMIPTDHVVVIGAGLAFAEAVLHLIANHYDGVDVSGPLKWVVRLAAFAKKITPGGMGREVAKKTNPHSLGAKSHDDAVKAKLAGEIAKAGNGANHNAI